MLRTRRRSLASGQTGVDQLVERHRIEDEVVAERVELQRLVVDDRGARARASARLPSPSPGSSRRGNRLPSSARCSRACSRESCTRWAAPRCSTGTCSCPTPGTPIRRIDRSSTMLAVWLPDPLTVATWMLKSLTTRCLAAGAPAVPEPQDLSVTFASPYSRMKIEEYPGGPRRAGDPRSISRGC